MKNFIDTNIALGYSLSCDKWHIPAQKFIFENEEIIWSNNVQKEFNIKFKLIFNTIYKFLSKISTILTLNEKCFVNYDSFEKFILRNTNEFNFDYTKKRK